MQWQEIQMAIRKCHSKQAWASFSKSYSNELSNTNSSKLISDIFRALKSDPLSHNYCSNLWQALLSGCLSSWDLTLGTDIARYIESIPHSGIRLKACEIYLENGAPKSARSLAQKSLKLKAIDPAAALLLQLTICKSYVEEGRNRQASRMLIKIEKATELVDLSPEVAANLYLNIGRSKFFLGQYKAASDFFYQSYQKFIHLEKWEFAASALFNSAACLHNCGNSHQAKGFEHLKECRKLSETHELPGPLSHCYAFHGTHFHNQGQFSKSADHYRMALKLLPNSEKSFRKLHILSMLTYSLFQDGQFKLAKHYGMQTFSLAETDKSERFKIRYVALKSELYWQTGKIAEAINNLREACFNLNQTGINTLEELSAISQFNNKCSLIGQAIDTNIRVSPNLKSASASWTAYQLSLAFQALVAGRIIEAQDIAAEAYKASKKGDFHFIKCQSISILILSKIGQNVWSQELDRLIHSLESESEEYDFHAFKAQTLLFKSAKSYRLGNFMEFRNYLLTAEKVTRLPFDTTLVLETWIQTLKGKAKRINSDYAIKLTTPMTKILFAPSLTRVAKGLYLISNKYQVSLENHATLNQLLEFLLAKEGHTATAPEIQTKVWQQSTKAEGWKQKIRNSISRLRQLFPNTLVPLITYNNGIVRLQSNIITIYSQIEEVDSEKQIISLLQSGPLTTVQIANRIKYSSSTLKRILRDMKERKVLDSKKEGRRVYYYPSARIS